MKKSVSLLLICALGGCTGMSRAMEYNQGLHHVRVGNEAYRVFEHPKENMLMTTPSVAGSFASGAMQGLTLGLVDATPPEKLHEQAARSYLDETDRANCKITRGYLLVKPQYEFTFECPANSENTNQH
nr:hypothetical protein [uncultured Cohaesibacter sp.]